MISVTAKNKFVISCVIVMFFEFFTESRKAKQIQKSVAYFGIKKSENADIPGHWKSGGMTLFPSHKPKS